MPEKITMTPTAEEWLAQSPWWADEQSYKRHNLTDYGFWTFYSEDDGMGKRGGRIGTLEGRLIDCLRHIIEKYGDSFYGWGHQGKIYKTSPIMKIPLGGPKT
jgi:hypothetical protein